MSVQSPMEDLFAELLDDYFAECEEHLGTMRRDLLALEAFVDGEQVDPSLIDELFRSFHTVKGLSGMVGFDEAQELAHRMESYLRLLRKGEASLTPAGLDVLAQGVRLLEAVLSARQAGQPIPTTEEALAQLDALVSEPPSAPPTTQAAKGMPAAQPNAQAPHLRSAPAPSAIATSMWRFVFHPSHQLTARGINVNVIRERLEGLGKLHEARPHTTEDGAIYFEFVVEAAIDEDAIASWRDDGVTWEPIQRQPERPREQEAPATTAAPGLGLTTSGLIRVDLSRLNELMRLVGDLVITRSRLRQQINAIRGAIDRSSWRSLQETQRQLERQLRDLREAIIRTRMVPIAEVFSRMPFAVREVARESGKQARVEVEGHDTEIDKFVVDRLMDPLLHLVRNAVSHGLETPDERRARGKPPEGTIRLSARTVGDAVVIEVADDGRGVDFDRVAAKAREAGLLGQDETLTEAMLLDVLCAPGFSTRDAADMASGRGMGMSAVRNAVRELGGTLMLRTMPGQGTRFTIQIPLTLAIVDALIVAVGDARFAVPLPSVQEVIEVEPEAITRVNQIELVRYRSGVLPLVHLAHHFGLEEKFKRVAYALVVGSELQSAGIVVDRIVAQREIVVHPITDPLVSVPGISGATELGDGRVILILDTASLIRREKRAHVREE
ncbi:MAG: chemotaxis protein CheA [Anaerolineae bacterium]